MTKPPSIDHFNGIRPFIPSIIALINALWASSLFHVQGEADAHAPLFLGLGIAIFWRLKQPNIINRAIRWSALMIFSIFMIERSLPHSAWKTPNWVDVAYSPSLLVCGFNIYLVGVISWFIDHTLQQEETSASDPDVTILPPQNAEEGS